MVGSPFNFRARRLAKTFGIIGQKVVWGLGKSPRDGVLRIEDGFIRSIDPGKSDIQLSLCVDDLGIYYNAGHPSRFQKLLVERQSTLRKGGPDHDIAQRARALIAKWRSARISKYNHGREYTPPKDPFVLVVDQTFGDRSIIGGLADGSSFSRMVDAALSEYPHHRILVKIHPDTAAGLKKGALDLARLRDDPRVDIIAGHHHPVSLIEAADAVYTVTSQMGFEALIWGKRTRVFGMPFYAGLGLTEDDINPPKAREPASLEALVHVALVDYVRYRHPETGLPATPESVMDWVGLQRFNRQRFPEKIQVANVSERKWRVLRQFLQGSTLTRALHSTNGPSEPSSVPHLVWGNHKRNEAAALRAEDGFIRSVGLAADQTMPFSLTFDSTGIHFDPNHPSELEAMLKRGVTSKPMLERAQRLRHQIIQEGITKYNLQGREWIRPASRDQVILAVGQVPSDASIRWGAVDVLSDIDLLKLIRADNPSAYIVFKPHPDTVARIRRHHIDLGQAASLANEIVSDFNMIGLYNLVDEVHTITSGAGFEALLRGKKTVCYGLPFYSGWGLTQDRHNLARRGVARSIDELVAVALIEFPVYLNPKTGRYTTPEQIIDQICKERERRPVFFISTRRFIFGLYNRFTIDRPSPTIAS